MAVFNEILVGRFNRALQKFLGTKGPPPAPQIATEFMPVFGFPLGADFRYLEGWNKFGVSLAPLGGAGTFGAMQIRNPTGSGVVGILERAIVTNITAAIVQFQLYFGGGVTADLGALVTVQRFDARAGGSSVTSGSLNVSTTAVASSSAPGSSGNVLGVQVLANANYDLIPHPGFEIPILPGDMVRVVPTTANIQNFCAFWWRERVLEDSEKT